MAKVTLYVPDDVLEAFKRAAGPCPGDVPSMSGMFQGTLRRFIAASNDGTWLTSEQRIDRLEADLQNLIAMLRVDGANI